MFNFDLFDLVFHPALPQHVCANATHVSSDECDLFILQNGRVVSYNALNGTNNNFDPNKELPEVKCITSFTLLALPQKLWFGTGKQFVCICTSSYTLSFILNEEKEFNVAEWNSNQDTLVIIRTDGEIATYAVDFSNNCMLPLHKTHLDNEAVAYKSVSVGWGSEKTQFDHAKIKRITYSKKATSDIENENNRSDIEEPVLIDDDMKPRLCWKPDGSKFAINYYANGSRKIKLYLSDCNLLYIYEDIIGLQPVIVWRPSSTHISTVVWTTKQYSFTLLGKTSLERYSFKLQCKDRIEDIKWGSTGQDLVIQQRNSTGFTTLRLYTILNYEWYIKQCLHFTPQNPLIAFEFLSIPPRYILQVSTFKEVAKYSFRSVVHHNGDITSEDGLTVAIIDGQKVYLSHCKEGVIPLPMYHMIIHSNYPINFLTFHPKKKMLAMLDSVNTLSVYSFTTDSFKLISENKIPCLNDTDIPLQIRNICWKNDKEIVCLKTGNLHDKNKGHVYFLEMNGKPEEWSFTQQRDCDKNIHYVSVVRDTDLIIQRSFNIVTLYDAGKIKYEVALPSMALYLDVVIVNGKTYVFGLSTNNIFMVNDVEVHHSVASFIIHDNFLILATNDYKLMIFRINSISIKNLHTSKYENLYVRPMDVGNQLLFVIPNTSNIVMLHRRGNIEINVCKMITIDRAESLIETGQWSKAMHSLRLQKVNLNVIIDLDGKRFLNNVDTIIETVYSKGLLNEFLISLIDENVFQTIYKELTVKSIEPLKNKRKVVCDAMIASMSRFNYIHFIDSITIAEVMKSSILEALKHINYLLNISTEENSYIDVAETTLNILQTLAPTTELYYTALSMYNLELAVFIAVKINLDPQEYQPLLTELEQLEEIQARFVINKYLKQYRKALPYYIRFGTDEDIYSFIVEHDLGKFAYTLLKPGTKLFYKVLMLVTTTLSKENKHDEAAALYLCADLKIEALKEYVAGLLWKPALQLMLQLNLPSPLKSDYLTTIISGLLNKGLITDAAHLLEVYLHNYEEAIKILVKHEMFIEAFETAQRNGRQDVIEVDIQAALEGYFERLLEKILTIGEDFKKYKNRLCELRQQKKVAYLKSTSLDYSFHDTYPDECNDVCSIGDSTLTAVSTKTSRTGFTVKSAQGRKAARRKEDLRYGSHFEDIALIKNLYNLIEEAFRYGPLIHDLILLSVAAKIGVKTSMERVHNKLLLLQLEMNSDVKHIWPSEMNHIERSSTMDANVFMYQNICELDVKYRVPPPHRKMTWPLEILLAHH